MIVRLTLSILTVGICYGNPDAKRLYDDLLSNYNRLIRPVPSNNDTIVVKLGLRLSQLIDLVSHCILFSLSRSLHDFYYLSPLFLSLTHTRQLPESQGPDSHHQRLARARKSLYYTVGCHCFNDC